MAAFHSRTGIQVTPRPESIGEGWDTLDSADLEQISSLESYEASENELESLPSTLSDCSLGELRDSALDSKAASQPSVSEHSTPLLPYFLQRTSSLPASTTKGTQADVPHPPKASPRGPPAEPACESWEHALPKCDVDLLARDDLPSHAPATLLPPPPSPTQPRTPPNRRRRLSLRRQCKQQSRGCTDVCRPCMRNAAVYVTVLILIASICSGICLLSCRFWCAPHSSVCTHACGLSAHAYEPMRACQDLESVAGEADRMRLHHCLLLLLQHMHAPVAQLQGESTLEPVLTAYKDAVLEARAPLELAMHRSWTKDAELRRAAASLSESMSRLAGTDRYHFGEAFRSAVLSASKAPMGIAAVTADLQAADEAAMPQVGEPRTLVAARRAAAERDAEEAIAVAFRVVQELRVDCSRAVAQYKALLRQHKLDVRTYYHLVPLLVSELRPPTAAALPLRLHATLVHAKAHTRAWATRHSGWFREVLVQHEWKLRNFVLCTRRRARKGRCIPSSSTDPSLKAPPSPSITNSSTGSTAGVLSDGLSSKSTSSAKDPSFVLGPRLLEMASADLEAACGHAVLALQNLLEVSAPLFTALTRSAAAEAHALHDREEA